MADIILTESCTSLRNVARIQSDNVKQLTFENRTNHFTDCKYALYENIYYKLAE